MIDLAQAVVVTPPDLSGPERKAVEMLIDEVAVAVHGQGKDPDPGHFSQDPARGFGAQHLRAADEAALDLFDLTQVEALAQESARLIERLRREKRS